MPRLEQASNFRKQALATESIFRVASTPVSLNKHLTVERRPSRQAHAIHQNHNVDTSHYLYYPPIVTALGLKNGWPLGTFYKTKLAFDQ